MNLEHNLNMVMEVALPPIDKKLLEEILKWHDQQKTLLNNPGSRALRFPWLATTIRDYEQNLKNSIELDYGISGNPWNRDFVENFQDFVEVINSIPLTEIKRIYLLETIKPCPTHVDMSKQLYNDLSLEPCNYRISMRENTSNSGFYIQPKPRKEWGNSRAILSGDTEYNNGNGIDPITWTPKVGHWWVLNNYCCQHGSTWQEGDNKVILSVQGTPDTKKHKELLERSKDCNKIDHPYKEQLNKFYLLP
jgi:hypothetical protein